jgi:hypothetical protein
MVNSLGLPFDSGISLLLYCSLRCFILVCNTLTKFCNLQYLNLVCSFYPDWFSTDVTYSC